jgi:hypothetical protein
MTADLQSDILTALEREDLTAEQLRSRLGVSHERLYLALVHIEASGRAEVVTTFSATQRTCCRWRNVETIA